MFKEKLKLKHFFFITQKFQLKLNLILYKNFNHIIKYFSSIKENKQKPKKKFSDYDPVPVLFLILIFYYDFYSFHNLVYLIYNNTLILTFIIATPSCWILLKNYIYIFNFIYYFYWVYTAEILPKVLAAAYALIIYLIVFKFFIFFAYLDIYYEFLF